MSGTPSDSTNSAEYAQYRAVCMSAVTTLVLGIISVPAILFSNLLFLPLIGVGLGLWALRQLRRRSDELTGARMASIGLALCLVVFISGTAYSSYVYATEVPEGYSRVHFSELQPEAGSNLPIPASAMKLNGKSVFVKGYIHPGVTRRKGIKQFVLVPDMKTCCFGGQPKLTDMIEVTLKDPLRVDYSYSQVKLAGVLKVSPYKKSVSGLDGVYYQLDADYVR
ncbi:MAG: DUF3299 domain-containing protein [Planctomycetaceae bacterium]|nr:DUF3299 domain-containing protein [Planctomycetaceae bacterium]